MTLIGHHNELFLTCLLLGSNLQFLVFIGLSSHLILLIVYFSKLLVFVGLQFAALSPSLFSFGLPPKSVFFTSRAHKIFQDSLFSLLVASYLN